MTDLPEPPPFSDEEETISTYDIVRRVAFLIFAAASASIFAAVLIYLLVE